MARPDLFFICVHLRKSVADFFESEDGRAWVIYMRCMPIATLWGLPDVIAEFFIHGLVPVDTDVSPSARTGRWGKPSFRSGTFAEVNGLEK